MYFRSARIRLPWTVLVAGMILFTSNASAFENDSEFPPMARVLSAEGALVHFNSGRLAGGFLNAWNVGARFSVLPFGVIHKRSLLRGALDGALEVGLEPTFERFNTVHQNFAGVLFELRYYLVRLSFGPFVPWIGGAIGPGYSDLDIGRTRNDSKLEGPFMALIKGEVGVAWFIDNHRALYAGLEAQHLSNGGFNGSVSDNTTNLSLNTPAGLVMGFSWFFR